MISLRLNCLNWCPYQRHLWHFGKVRQTAGLLCRSDRQLPPGSNRKFQTRRLEKFKRCVAITDPDESDSHDGSQNEKHPGSPLQPHWRSKVSIQGLKKLCEAAGNKLDAFLMPRERGDMRDVMLMSVSLAVLVYLSMQLYRVYAMLYYAAGLHPIMDHLY
eukprot:jgi/Botrbrau1/19757/Bobra.0124s0010.1